MCVFVLVFLFFFGGISGTLCDGRLDVWRKTLHICSRTRIFSKLLFCECNFFLRRNRNRHHQQKNITFTTHGTALIRCRPAFVYTFVSKWPGFSVLSESTVQILRWPTLWSASLGRPNNIVSTSHRHPVQDDPFKWLPSSTPQRQRGNLGSQSSGHPLHLDAKTAHEEALHVVWPSHSLKLLHFVCASAARDFLFLPVCAYFSSHYR